MPVSGGSMLWVGYLAPASAAGAYLFAFRREDGGAGRLIALALLSALLIPFLLPKMHERFFFLADVLGFVLAFVRRDRASWLLFALVETSSMMALAGLLLKEPLAPIAGAFLSGGAIVLLVRELLASGADKSGGTAPESATPALHDQLLVATVGVAKRLRRMLAFRQRP